MALKAKFVGDGTEYVNGIPARDLDDEEWEALDEDAQDLVLLAPTIYDVRGAATRVAKLKAAAAAIDDATPPAGPEQAATTTTHDGGTPPP